MTRGLHYPTCLLNWSMHVCVYNNIIMSTDMTGTYYGLESVCIVACHVVYSEHWSNYFLLFHPSAVVWTGQIELLIFSTQNYFNIISLSLPQTPEEPDGAHLLVKVRLSPHSAVVHLHCTQYIVALSENIWKVCIFLVYFYIPTDVSILRCVALCCMYIRMLLFLLGCFWVYSSH